MIKLTEIPQKAEIKEYESTRQSVISKYKNTDGILEVLEFGLIPYPGISDMDFLVVTKDNTEITMPSLKMFTTRERYLMSHMHFIISESIVPFLRDFDPWLIKIDPLIQGDSSPFSIKNVEPRSAEDRFALSLEHIISGWLLSDISLAAEISITGEFPVRTFLEGAKGTEYCFRDLHNGGFSPDPSDPNTPFFTNLRKSWFTLSDKERIDQCTTAATMLIQSMKSLTEITKKCLAKKSKILDITPLPAKEQWQKSLLQKFPNSFINRYTDTITVIYQQNRNQIECFRKEHTSKLSGAKISHMILALPLELSATQNMYLKGDGIVSEQYANTCCTDLTTLPFLQHEAIKTRVLHVNQAAAKSRQVIGGKQPIASMYGAELTDRDKKSGNIRSILGGIYDRSLQKKTRYLLVRNIQKKCTQSICF